MKCLLAIIMLVSINASAQTVDGKFEEVYKYRQSKMLFISPADSTICYKIGRLYKIMSLRDSICMEPSYPWHRKTLMGYHVNDYDRLVKIDTNRANYDTWIEQDETKIRDSIVLHKFAFAIDTLRIRFAPDTIFAWVNLNQIPADNWMTQTLNLFGVFKGVPLSASVVSIEYGKSEISLRDLEFSGNEIDFGVEVKYPVTIEQMEDYVKKGTPWSD